MLDHVSLGTHDLGRTAAFYSSLLATLGYRLHRLDVDEAAFGPGEEWVFFLYPAAEGATPVGARMHVAFRAASRADALAFERVALELGAERVREVAERPQFGTDYFGGVLRDLDGHTIEVLARAR